LLTAASLAVAGCEPTAKRQVQSRPPAGPPPGSEVTPARLDLPLPLRTRDHPGEWWQASLAPEPRSAVEILLEKVDASFRSGEENYRTGHLEKARHDFDRAVDWLLGSGIDLRSDPRLEQLFGRTVTAIHSYEVQAFREGDGFAEQKPQPAPLDEIPEISLPADPRLKERAEAELLTVPHDLPLTVNEQVLAYLDFFQTPRGRAIVERGLQRAGRYRSLIARILREEGLPLDLLYLAQAESAFQPAALSRAGARGIWQFMAGRAREYGLRRSWWLDERQDPEKSTRAAARHLRDLYAMFGDWYLVMAAYNSGPATVAKAIERTGYADFWELYRRKVLPRETKNYVPIILALTLICKDPVRYGIEVTPDAPVQVDSVKPGHPIDLRLVAETIDTSVDVLRSLNPQLLRLVTPPDPEFRLALPAGTAERFFAEIAEVPPEKWVSWRRHRISPGETLGTLAKKYRTTAQAIAEVNGLGAKQPVQVGQKLIIPAAPSETAQGKLLRHRVRRGDTLASIAEQFSVTVADLKRWNGIRGDRVSRGAVLRVYPAGRHPASANSRSRNTGPSRSASAETNPDTGRTVARPGKMEKAVIHQVKPGETLWSIARNYGTSVEELRTANGFLVGRALQVGDQVRIVGRR